MAGGRGLRQRRRRKSDGTDGERRSRGRAPADQLALQQLGAVVNRLRVPSAAKEVLLGAAVVLADAYREAWEEASHREPRRGWADPRNLGDWRRWKEWGRQAAEGLRPLLEDAERLAITAGVLWPLPLQRRVGTEPVSAGVLTFAASLSEEALAVASSGASLASLVATVPVLEILEAYLTASARTNVYRRAELAYDVTLVTADLHAGLTGTAQGHSMRLGAGTLLAELADRAVDKLASRVWQAIVLGAGAAWAGVGAGGRVARVVALPVVRDAAVVTPRPPEGPSRKAVSDALRDRLAGGPPLRLPGLPA